MVTNNAINLKDAGIAYYDGAGTFSALAIPLSVPNGGFESTSYTPYSVLCAGTTSTSPVQNVSGTGSSGQVLVSNGSSALPTWQNYSSNAAITFYSRSISLASPNDGVTAYITTNASFNTYQNSFGATRMYIPISGTITQCQGIYSVTATGSSETVTFAIRLNNTTNTTVANVTFDVSSQTFSNTSLSIAVSAGDYIDFIVICPVWSSDPANAAINYSILVVK